MAQISRDKALKAAVIPSYARVAQDWPRILNALDRYGYLVVRLRYDIDPRSLISDFKELPKRTVEALACADVVWAGELNGKTIASLREELSEEAFLQVVRCFFAEPEVTKQTIKEYLKAKAQEKPVQAVFSLPSQAVAAVVKLVIGIWREKRTEAAGMALRQAQSIQWCVNSLLIRYPLLKQLRVFESEDDYAATFNPLGVEFPRIMICKNTTGLDVKAFFVWAHGAGVSAKQMEEVYRIWRKHDGTGNASVLIPVDAAPAPKPVTPMPKPVAPAPPKAVEPEPGELREVHTPSPMSLGQLRAERAMAKQKALQAEREKLEADAKLRDAQIEQTIAEILQDKAGCSISELMRFMSEKGRPILLKALKERADVVVLAEGCYSAKHIVGLEEAGVVISKALETLFEKGGGYTSAHELFKVVRDSLDDFFYDNGDFETEREVYDLAVHFFEKCKLNGKSYLFYNNTHIWRERPDYDTSDFGLLIHWARQNGGLLTKDLGYEKLAQRGATSMQVPSAFSQAIAKALDKFWIVEEDVYLLKEGHDVSPELLHRMKSLLDELWSMEFEDPGIDFIPMGIISDEFFAELPELAPNQKWTPCLLQSVIADYSKELGYRTMARANAREVHAAILPLAAEHADYSDLVRAVIKAVFKQQSKEFYIYDLQKFLVEQGLWPDDVGYTSFLETSLKKNINFQFVDKYNLVVT